MRAGITPSWKLRSNSEEKREEPVFDVASNTEEEDWFELKVELSQK